MVTSKARQKNEMQSPRHLSKRGRFCLPTANAERTTKQACLSKQHWPISICKARSRHLSCTVTWPWHFPDLADYWSLRPRNASHHIVSDFVILHKPLMHINLQVLTAEVIRSTTTSISQKWNKCTERKTWWLSESNSTATLSYKRDS